MLGSVVFPLVNPAAGEILKIGFPAFLLTVIAFGWGLYTRARRELVASLRERAARLEADQQHSAEQAREAGHLCIQGDATNEATLQDAGIDLTARTLQSVV